MKQNDADDADGSVRRDQLRQSIARAREEVARLLAEQQALEHQIIELRYRLRKP